MSLISAIDIDALIVILMEVGLLDLLRKLSRTLIVVFARSQNQISYCYFSSNDTLITVRACGVLLRRCTQNCHLRSCLIIYIPSCPRACISKGVLGVRFFIWQAIYSRRLYDYDQYWQYWSSEHTYLCILLSCWRVVCWYIRQLSSCSVCRCYVGTLGYQGVLWDWMFWHWSTLLVSSSARRLWLRDSCTKWTLIVCGSVSWQCPQFNPT